MSGAIVIMTDRGWQPLYSLSEAAPEPAKWWHFAHADPETYDRQFKRSDGTDIRDGTGRRLIE